MAHTDNLTVGKGRLFFEEFAEGQLSGTGNYRFLGNAPTFNINQEIQKLDHFSSTGGLRRKDRSVTLQNDMGAQFTVDDIAAKNLALLFAGEATTETIGAVSSKDITVDVTELPLYIQVGVTDDNPQGDRDITAVTLTGGGVRASGTITFGGQPTADDTLTVGSHVMTFVATGASGAEINIGASATETAANTKAYLTAHTADTGVTPDAGGTTVVTVRANTGGTAGNSIALAKSGTNPTVSGATLAGGAAGSLVSPGSGWEVDLESGLVTLDVDIAGVAVGDTISISYDVVAGTEQQIVDGASSIYGALMFISDNPVGDNYQYTWPYVEISASGDFGLISEEWQTMAFDVEILKRDDNTGRAYARKRVN